MNISGQISPSLRQLPKQQPDRSDENQALTQVTRNLRNWKYLLLLYVLHLFLFVCSCHFPVPKKIFLKKKTYSAVTHVVGKMKLGLFYFFNFLLLLSFPAAYKKCAAVCRGLKAGQVETALFGNTYK